VFVRKIFEVREKENAKTSANSGQEGLPWARNPTGRDWVVHPTGKYG
jgi:hypothetical protein